MLSHPAARWQVWECVCALAWVSVFSPPPESCISVEQCEHMVSELQHSMRRAIHLYRRVSDLGLDFLTGIESICLLPQAACLSLCLHLQLGRQKLLIPNFWLFQWLAMVL